MPKSYASERVSTPDLFSLLQTEEAGTGYIKRSEDKRALKCCSGIKTN